jgi:branched-chain amino acid transport system permease protein
VAGCILSGLLLVVGIIGAGAFVGDVAAAACIKALYVLSWGAFCGPSRELSFGHALFVGMAGYAAALAQTRLGWAPAAALITGTLAGTLSGSVIAGLTFRQRGLSFSMITMAIQVTFYRSLFVQSALFGGEEGVVGVRPLVDTRTGIYVATALSLVLCYAAVTWFLHSRVGLLLAASGQEEDLSRSVGVSVPRARLLGLLLSGAVAGLGGALYVTTHGQANTDLAGEALSIRVVLLGLLGGMWSAPGAIGATFMMEILDMILSRITTYDALASTALLLGLVLIARRGLLPMRPRWGAARLSPIGRSPEAPASDATLSMRNVTVRHGGITALDSVTLEVRPGSAVGVIGPNGAGKSTLLDVVGGRRRPASGQVLYGQIVTSHSEPSANARSGVIRLFQRLSYFPELSPVEHLRVCGNNVSAPWVDRLMASCSYEGDAGGQPLQTLTPAAARVTQIAMALAARPRVLLLDEPFAGLPEDETQAVAEAIDEASRAGVTVVIVEHRLGELFPRVDTVVVMHQGKIIADGVPATVLLDPKVREAYGLPPETGP